MAGEFAHRKANIHLVWRYFDAMLLGKHKHFDGCRAALLAPVAIHHHRRRVAKPTRFDENQIVRYALLVQIVCYLKRFSRHFVRVVVEVA